MKTINRFAIVLLDETNHLDSLFITQNYIKNFVFLPISFLEPVLYRITNYLLK